MHNKKPKSYKDPKAAFRRSKPWHDLRMRTKKKQKYDYVTGSPLTPTYNLHHICEDPERYSDISDESLFVGLNSTSHTCIHFLWGDGKRRFNWKERLERLKELCERMDEVNGVE